MTLLLLLDPNTGFAPRLRQLCRDQITEAENSASSDVSQEELDVLRMEANTWADYSARKTEPEPHVHPRTLLAKNPYTPTSTLAQAIMHSSVLLTELVVALRTGSGIREGLADGRSLAADDAGFEKSLAQALYSFVRAGRLDEAVELCRKAHQPWRAASIRGSLLFQWRAIGNNGTDDGIDDTEDAEGWQGNPRRKLWKSTCARAALNPNLPDPERILYAALAPCPQTFSVLKSACRTWEDHLWAQISILCEEKQTAEMIKLVLENMPSPPSHEEDAAEEEEWEREATSTLETLGSVHFSPTADHAFHVSQLAIILDRTSSLLETFAAGLKDGNFDPESSEYPTMTRFFAHLCLYLRMIDIPVPPLATQVVLEAYLQVLEAAGQRELIAMYAGALGDNAVERYAMFLTSLELTCGHQRTVAVVTAERTIDRAFELLPQMKGPLPSVIALQATASDIELLLLRSIEWTTFEDGTYDTALEQATVILRYFLGAGRVSLAKSLVEMLPRELASIDQPEERATEYLHYRQFFTIWDSLDRVVECQSLEVSIMNRDTRAAWLSDYKGLMDQAYDAVVKLLTSDWMMPDETGDRRSRELTRVRQIYVPELILRLHVMLYASREHVPENLKRALELANVVADSRYKLYDDFLHLDGRRLGEYLDAVRRATIAGLEGGGSDPFKIILS
ncbi:nuclear pore protein 84/107 [Suillus subalutaceus]|uniref:nuclear pore protein 84/107 n=1 Tax=Suillus subalutaceus TaxID=48586 RepID=UPI001B87C89F|nr:nuclear pore protein 84/107 [Suillus subalutaceus]KAG1856995.1 nuclear pore protein 84/107 [Suillus subalutaceus]